MLFEDKVRGTNEFFNWEEDGISGEVIYICNKGNCKIINGYHYHIGSHTPQWSETEVELEILAYQLQEEGML